MSARTDAVRVMDEIFGPDHEFWKQDTERTFRHAAITLLLNGFDQDDTAAFLGTLWSAASNEYGA